MDREEEGQGEIREINDIDSFCEAGRIHVRYAVSFELRITH